MSIFDSNDLHFGGFDRKIDRVSYGLLGKKQLEASRRFFARHSRVLFRSQVSSVARIFGRSRTFMSRTYYPRFSLLFVLVSTVGIIRTKSSRVINGNSLTVLMTFFISGCG